jgi:hypothetical protein
VSILDCLRSKPCEATSLLQHSLKKTVNMRTDVHGDVTCILESCFEPEISLCVLKMRFGDRAFAYVTFDMSVRSYTVPLCLDGF